MFTPSLETFDDRRREMADESKRRVKQIALNDAPVADKSTSRLNLKQIPQIDAMVEEKPDETSSGKGTDDTAEKEGKEREEVKAAKRKVGKQAVTPAMVAGVSSAREKVEVEGNGGMKEEQEAKGEVKEE